MKKEYRRLHVDENIVLEQLDVADAELLYGIIDGDRTYLAEFLLWPDKTQSVEDSENFLASVIEKRREGSEYGFGIKYDGKLAGHTSLMHLADENSPEIGYWVTSSFKGKGVATRVAKRLTEFCFDDLQQDHIIIRAEPLNIGSNRVAEKCGYTYVGTEEKDGRQLNVWRISR